MKDPFVKAATPEGVLPTCSVGFEEISTIRNVHTFDEVERIVANRMRPVLFKGFTNDVKGVWSYIEEHHKDAKLRFSHVKITSFGNMFMNGIEPHGDVTYTLHEAWNAATNNSSDESFFASFVPFLDKDSTSRALNGGRADRIKVDTNFVSNFQSDVLATHIHSATVNSFSVQLLGKKLWLFMSPQDMEKYEPISTPPPFLLGGSEADYFSSVSAVPYVLQEEGDLLYFPPLWGHAVITKAGPNVMLNMRETRPLKVLFDTPFRAIETMMSVVVSHGGFGKRQPFSHAIYTGIQGALRRWQDQHRDVLPNRASPDTPCKGFFKELLNN